MSAPRPRPYFLGAALLASVLGGALLLAGLELVAAGAMLVVWLVAVAAWED